MMNTYTVRLNSQLKFLYTVALHMVISAKDRMKTDPDLGGMSAYVSNDPNTVKYAKMLLPRLRSAHDSMQVSQNELYALYTASQDLQGTGAALCDEPYFILLGCTQDDLTGLIENLQLEYESTPRYQNMMNNAL